MTETDGPRLNESLWYFLLFSGLLNLHRIYTDRPLLANKEENEEVSEEEDANKSEDKEKSQVEETALEVYACASFDEQITDYLPPALSKGNMMPKVQTDLKSCYALLQSKNLLVNWNQHLPG